MAEAHGAGRFDGVALGLSAVEPGGEGSSREGLLGIWRVMKLSTGGGDRLGVSSLLPAWLSALAMVAARAPVMGGRGGLESGEGLHLRLSGWRGGCAAVNDQGWGLGAQWWATTR
jgi:hypothetical protein